MANQRTPSYRQESAQQEIERNRQLEAHDRVQATIAANKGRSAPHSAADTGGGISPQNQWDARNTPSANFLRLNPLPGQGPLPLPPSGEQPKKSAYQTNNFIPNPPPMNNLIPGSAATASLAPRISAYATSLPNPLTGPGGNAATDRADYEQNLGLYAPGGMTARAAIPQPPAQTVFQPSQTDVAGIQGRYQTPGTTASFTPGTATDIAGNSTSNGVPFNQASSRASLYASHPQIFQSGTPENTAFVSHAQQYGEPSAHANIDTVLDGTNTTTSQNQQQGPPKPQEITSTPDAVASEDKPANSASAQVPNRVSPY